MKKKEAGRPRNPVARAQILRKGGAHGRSRKAERKAARDALRGGRAPQPHFACGSVEPHDRLQTPLHGGHFLRR